MIRFKPRHRSATRRLHHRHSTVVACGAANAQVFVCIIAFVYFHRCTAGAGRCLFWGSKAQHDSPPSVQVEEMGKAVDVAERNTARFGLTQAEVASRRRWIMQTQREVRRRGLNDGKEKGSGFHSFNQSHGRLKLALCSQVEAGLTPCQSVRVRSQRGSGCSGIADEQQCDSHDQDNKMPGNVVTMMLAVRGRLRGATVANGKVLE